MGEQLYRDTWAPTGDEACIFPVFNTGFEGDDVLAATPVRLVAPEAIANFCHCHDIHPSRLLQAAWAILLKSYTGSDCPLFLYLDDKTEPREGKLGAACCMDLTEDQHIVHWVRNLACWDEIFSRVDERQQLNTAVLWNCSPKATVEFSVSVEAHGSETGWTASLNYTTSVLSDEQAFHATDLLAHILSELVQHRTLSSLNLCSPRTVDQVARWNSEPPREMNSCVHDFILEHCRSRPNSPAVCAWDGNFSYRDIDRLSLHLAQHLAKRGVGPEIFVGVYFEKSKWVVVSVLAIIRAGGAFLLLDPSFPTLRLQELTRKLDTALILSQRSLMEDAAALNLDVMPVDAEQLDLLEPLPLDNPEQSALSAVQSHNALFSVFTSGSTGTPKGIVVNHSSHASGQTEMAARVGLNSSSRVLQFSSYAFDVSIMDHLTTLMVGGCLCIPSESDRRSNIPLVISQMGVNTMFTTPTVARLLRPSDIPSVKTLFVGGEPLLPVEVTTWAGHLRLIGLYGPAECTEVTTVQIFADGSKHFNLIGSAVAAICWVTDPSDCQKLVSVGAIGELLVEGPIVARGYAKDSEKTEQSFVSSPRWRSHFPGKPYGRMYRTGDLVQYVSDGKLRYIGRIDSQAKLRGQRMELGEVEHKMRQVLPGNLNVVAELVVPAGKNSATILVGFVPIPSSNGSEDEHADPASDFIASPCEEFRTLAQAATAELAKRLPRYMVPSAMVPVKTVPTTRSGKVDRRGIRNRASKLTRQQLEAFSRATTKRRLPTTRMEILLCQAIEKVLDVQDFGMDDDYFGLGGDSIRAMALTRLAREEMGLDIPGDQVFKTPMLSDLALAMKFSQNDAEIPPFALLGHRDLTEILQAACKACDLSSTEEVEDMYPCTQLQEGLMALSNTSKTTKYVMRSVYRLPRAIDCDRLKGAWTVVIQGNPVLRTRIIQISSEQTLQVVVKGAAMWKHGDSLDDCIRRDMAEGMQLGDPLLRLVLVEEDDKKYLVLTIHHSLYDGWSLPRTLEQVEMAYYGHLPQLKPFNTFVSHLLNQEEQTMMDYWKTKLEDFSGPLWPAAPSGDHNYRPTTTRLMKRPLMLAAQASQLKQLAVTMTTLIRLSWALTVSQYSGSQDVVFGLTLAGRNVPVSGIDQILGPTLTTVPLRVRLQGSSTVRDMLHRLQEQSARSMEFEHAGLQRIAGLGAGPAAACRFQCLLIVQPRYEDEASTVFNKIVDEHSAEIIDHYILTLEVQLERDGCILLEAEYDPNAIPDALMDRILSQFGHNTSELMNGADKTLDELAAVDAVDLKTLQTWNHQVPEAIDCCVHDLVNRHCLSQPHEPAVVAWDGSLTYKELNDASTKLAAHLQSLGVGPGMYIIVCVGKSLWTVVSVMAIMKAGAAFVLTDPSLPLMRLRHICDDTDAMVAIASKELSDTVAALGLKMVQVDGDDGGERSAAQFREPAVSPESPVYAVFTSGSTGKPKGVVIQHRALATSATVNGAKEFTDKHSRCLQCASFTFDVSIIEMLYPLVHGGCVCIPSESDCRNKLEKAMQELEVNWATFTPSLARTLDPAKLTCLRTLVLGGEAMTQVDVEMWSDKVQLLNGYGPAECSVDTAIQASVSSLDPSNIGRGAAAVCWVVDPRDHARLRPIGAVGELVVEGPIVAQGYLKDEEKTAAAFVEYPEWLTRLRHGRRGRLYKTGDLAQYSAKDDGSLRYMGRKDYQVKLRGQRIELFEVEQHLRECLPEARHVIAEIVTPTDAGAEPVLTAFVLLEASASPSADEEGFFARAEAAFGARVEAVEALLRSRVPGYMIPALFLPLSHVPIASTGKADRRLLREQSSKLSRRELRAYSSSVSAKRAPSNTKESVLQQAISSVLRLPAAEVGMDDNFFHLGGDSITAMKLVAKARESSLVLRVSDIFGHPRVADLAQAMQHDDGDGSPAETTAPFSLLGEGSRLETLCVAAKECGVESEDIQDIYPCTPMQEALLALSMKKQGDYIANMVFDLPPDVEIGRLHTAWQAVCDANPILRTRFVPAPAGGNESLQAVLREQARWSSDLSPLQIAYGSPLMKISVSHDEGHCQLHLWLHHALYDGASLPGILEQAEAAYNGQALQRRPFSPFAAYTKTLDMEASKQFWRREFEDLNASMFPRRRTSKTSVPEQRASLSRSIHLGDATECHFTLPTMLHLACATVLGHYTASDDVVYGLTLSGRNAPIPTIEHVGGPTITTVPFRVQTPPSQTIRDSLSRIQHHLARLIPHEQVGLQRIRSINPETAAACDFQCHLVIQPADPGSPDALLKELPSDDDVYARFSSCPLLLVCEMASDRRSVQLITNFDLSCFDSTEAMTLCHQLEHVLQQIMGNQDTLLKDIEFASPHDMSRFASLNSTVPPTLDRMLHDLVFDQCQLRPMKEAICSWDGSLTYRELQDACTRLARYFVSIGVGAHPVTAVCMEKSRWTIVAILSVLKAGSACALMDPSHPVKRIEELLNQTGATFAVVSPRTQSVLAALSSSCPDVNVLPVSPSLLDTLPPAPASLTTAQGTCAADPAFVVFTSGSTGKPKGMVLEHRSIATGLRDLRGPLFLEDGVRVLHFASYAFDASFLEVLGSLTSGGCLCIPSDTERTADLDGFIQRYQVNWTFMIPSTSHLISPPRVPSLRTLILGGEMVKPGDVNRWADNMHKELTVVNGYGPAECTLICVASRMSATNCTPSIMGPCVSGMGWITQPSDPATLCAWGAIGELLIEGPILAREYIGDAERTAASFIPSPPWLSKFRGHSEGRLYRTGDLVQYTSDGQIRYISRMDRQVKLNGQRLEPGEIESNLKLLFPAEASIIVELVVPKSPQARPRLFAFVCLGARGGNDANGAEDKPVFAPSDEAFLGMCNTAKEGLSASLPQYMIPGAFILLNYVPETSSGKANRRQLCELASTLKAEELDQSSHVSSEMCLPSNETERKLVHLWAELLALPATSISTSDNFFHVGGDSVLAMRLVAGARQRGLHLTVALIFSSPRLSDMASVAGASQPEDTPDAVVDLKAFALVNQDLVPSVLSTAEQQCSVAREQIEDIYPCTPLQEGLVSQSIRTPGAYEARFRYKLQSDTDLSLFRHAWNTVANGNTILRTRIIQDSVLYQVVLHGDLPWTVLESDTLDDFMSALTKKELQLGQPLAHLVVSQPSGGAPTEFLLIIHHVLYDGWSLQLVMDQVQRAYAAQTISPQPFNRFMSHILKSDPQQVRDYWLSRLSEACASAFPPLPRADYKPFTDCVVRKTVPLRSPPGITKATVLQLAWAMVLSQYSDSSDVIFAMVLSGRNASMPGVESVTGPTITTVPVRFSLKDNESVNSELRRLQEQMTAMSPFEQFGLQNIRKLSAEAEAACRFQNMLLIQPPKTAPERGLLTPIDDNSNAGDFSTYALEVTCEVSDETVLISFDFDQKVLPARQAGRILAQLDHTLQQVQSRCDSKISELDLMSKPALEDIMGWNAVLSKPIERCVHDGIKQQCLKSPDAQAVCAHDGDFTYKELDELSYTLSVQLKALGVGPEACVPILAEKTRWVAIAMLGVIRAGGAVVLVDPAIPFQRMQTICEDVDARLILSSESCMSLATQLAPTAVTIGSEDAAAYQNGCQTNNDSQVGPHNALYVIFTSGSTGKPKGIVTSHSAFYTSGSAQRQAIYLDENTRTLQFASHMFDVCIADYLWTFLVGGCVCIGSQASLRNDLVGVFNELRVNRADMTPSVARVLRPEDLPTLETILLGGEPMSQQDIQTWAGKVRLVNGYGPSECSVCCLLADVYTESDPSTIGHTYGAKSWITDKDDHNKLVPIGAIGELVLEGHVLARGYLGDQQKTPAAFIESSPPWLRALRPKSRLYKTGDLVQYNADGTIRFVGRKDTQVKIRGQRVELGEIEHHIRQLSPSIHDVVAEVIRPAYRKTGQILAVFICDQKSADGDVFQHDDGRKHLFGPSSQRHREESQRMTSALKSRLPVYMVPSVFIPLCRLPLSPSGKADRRLLRDKAAALSRKDMEAYQPRHVAQRPPKTASEKALQAIVCDILNLEAQDVGMDDDFFRLGGDSIIAIRLVQRAWSSSFSFRVTDVFKTPTLSELALRTIGDETDEQSSQSSEGTSSFQSLEMPNKDDLVRNLMESTSDSLMESDVQEVLPVTHAAERYLFQTPEYWIVNLQGTIDVDRLQMACTALVQRHGVLRSVYVPNNAKFAQLVLSQIDTRIDRRTTTSSIAEFVDEYRRSDDIAMPTLAFPITQFMFVQNSEGYQALVVRLSHVQFDGYSLHVLWNDLKRLYEGASLPDATSYSSHMKLWAQCQTEDAFSFWRNTLKGSLVSRIDNASFDKTRHYPTSEDSQFVTSTRTIRLDESVPSNITTATVVKAAWSILLAQLTGRNDVVFAQTSNGRNNTSESTQDVFGMCLNIIPVRMKLSSTWTVPDLLQFLQSQHQQSLDFELLDLRDIVAQSTGWLKGTTHQSIIVHQNIDPDLPFPFGEAEALVTCSYEWPHPPDEILIESRPMGNGELQMALDTRSNILIQEHSDMVIEKLCDLITLISSLSDDPLVKVTALFT